MERNKKAGFDQKLMALAIAAVATGGMATSASADVVACVGPIFGPPIDCVAGPAAYVGMYEEDGDSTLGALSEVGQNDAYFGNDIPSDLTGQVVTSDTTNVTRQIYSQTGDEFQSESIGGALITSDFAVVGFASSYSEADVDAELKEYTSWTPEIAGGAISDVFWTSDLTASSEFTSDQGTALFIAEEGLVAISGEAVTSDGIVIDDDVAYFGMTPDVITASVSDAVSGDSSRLLLEADEASLQVNGHGIEIASDVTTITGGVNSSYAAFSEDEVEIGFDGAEAVSITSDTTTVHNDLNVEGSTWLDGTLDVDGSAEFDSDVSIAMGLDVNGDAQFSDNVSVDGDLDVDGQVWLQDTLDVDGSAEFDSDVTIAAGLDVNGDANFSDNVSVQGELDVDGPVWLQDTLDVDGSAEFDSDVTVAAGLDVSGGTVTDTLDVSGVATFSDNVNIHGDLAMVSDGSITTGNIVIDGMTDTITVGSNSTIIMDNYINLTNGTTLSDNVVTTGTVIAAVANISDINATTVDADVVTANTGNITTVNATTVNAAVANISDINATTVDADVVTANTGNITTVNATTVNAATANISDVIADTVTTNHLQVNGDANVTGYLDVDGGANLSMGNSDTSDTDTTIAQEWNGSGGSGASSDLQPLQIDTVPNWKGYEEVTTNTTKDGMETLNEVDVSDEGITIVSGMVTYDEVYEEEFWIKRSDVVGSDGNIITQTFSDNTVTTDDNNTVGSWGELDVNKTDSSLLHVELDGDVETATGVVADADGVHIMGDVAIWGDVDMGGNGITGLSDGAIVSDSSAAVNGDQIFGIVATQALIDLDQDIDIGLNSVAIANNLSQIGFNAENIAANANAIEDLEDKVDLNESNASRGIAIANAMETFLPDPGKKFRMNIGGGFYNSESAIGITGSGRVGKKGDTALYIGVGSDIDGEEVGGKVGVSFQW
ncbi:MAG: YadA-like family protein [Pseudomonadales bacterium]